MAIESIKIKREKAEDFIGWKSPDGKLEVVGIIEKSKHTKFKVTCTECSKDPELFPDGYFVSTKSRLIGGAKPCGCAPVPKWKDWQFLILIYRATKGRFIIHGFAEEFHGQHTKINLECLKDGHKWAASISNILGRRGCPKCKYKLQKEKRKTPEHIALQKCIDICKDMDYDVIGFPRGYKNRSSCFEYICKIHGKQNVTYNNFVNHGTRCGGCWKEKQKQNSGFYGYYEHRKEEQDYLYVLNFDNKYIKIGRTFIFDKRIGQLTGQSGCKNISLVGMFTGKHKAIWDLEQAIHEQLRQKKLDFIPDNWYSQETFSIDALPETMQLLERSNFEQVS